MVSAQRNGGASVIAFRGIDVTPTTTDVTPPPSPTNEEVFNRRRHNHKYVYDSMDVLSYSIHIQFFSQNCLLLYLFQYQMIIIKRVDQIK